MRSRVRSGGRKGPRKHGTGRRVVGLEFNVAARRAVCGREGETVALTVKRSRRTRRAFARLAEDCMRMFGSTRPIRRRSAVQGSNGDHTFERCGHQSDHFAHSGRRQSRHLGPAPGWHLQTVAVDQPEILWPVLLVELSESYFFPVRFSTW